MRTHLLLIAATVAFNACGGRPAAKSDSPSKVVPPIDCDSVGRIGSSLVVEAANRKGPGEATTFRELAARGSIEVCKLDGQLRLLTRSKCDDGSRPFASRKAAHDSRVTTLAGQCGTTVDRYEVICPEKTYRIDLNLYFCTAAELGGAPLAKVEVAGLKTAVPVSWWLESAELDGLIIMMSDGDRRILVFDDTMQTTWPAIASALGLDQEAKPTVQKVGDDHWTRMDLASGAAIYIRTADGALAKTAVLITIADDPLAELLARELDTIIAATARSSHKLDGLDKMLASEQSAENDTSVSVESVGNVTAAVPVGWRTRLMGESTVRSEKGSLVLIQAIETDAKPPSDMDVFCRQTASRVTHQVGSYVWRVDSFEPPNSYIAIVDGESNRYAIQCYWSPDSKVWVLAVATGDVNDFAKHNVLKLLIRVATLTAQVAGRPSR